jgi:hypothetical protein
MPPTTEALQIRRARRARQKWTFGRNASRRLAVEPRFPLCVRFVGLFVQRLVQQTQRRFASGQRGPLRRALRRKFRTENQLELLEGGFAHDFTNGSRQVHFSEGGKA